MPHIDINYVDENNNVIGSGPMEDAWEHGHIHQVARLFVFSTRGEFLLQKRSMNHRNMPGRWDNSAAGHVDAGEDYRTAVIREAFEEIGLKDADATEVCTFYQDESEPGIFKKRWNMLFKTINDGPFTIDTNEVSEVRWISTQELEAWMNRSPDDFTPGLREAWKQYKSFQAHTGSLSLLRSEEFIHVFEWTDAPGTVYEPHAHKDRVAVITTAGSITFDIGGEKRIFHAGDRFDVPPGTTHSAVVGPEGWSCVVGEMIPGDS